MTKIQLPYSEPVRLHQIGANLERTLVPEAADRTRIAKALNLASLDSLTVDMTVVPTVSGFRMDGRVRAEAVQACGLSLEPMPVTVDRDFTVNFVHEAEPQNNEDGEIDIELDDNFPDVIEDGKIDLGQHAVEQLSLSLDPFPRKEGAVFVQPPEPVEISPFAALKALKDTSQG
ncbi:YceD family protein [Brevundimonas sp.]|uniref:YceD family protein n=1 Tax=Brevundimonas sp. TaxID=1871086 RepID=UPI002FCB4BB8